VFVFFAAIAAEFEGDRGIIELLPKRTIDPSTWVGQKTVSVIDFVPTVGEDTFQDVLQVMNDWLVRLPRSNERVISVDTVDTHWPMATVYAHSSGGIWSHPTYRVKLLRVFYRTEGEPSCEQCVVRREQPQIFHDLERPVVTYSSNQGTLVTHVDTPYSVNQDRAALVLMMALVLANAVLLAKIAFAG